MTAHVPSITLESIKDRCDEVADCWLWKNATTQGGYPIVKVRGCGCRFVRRVVLDLLGRPAMPRQPVVTTCGEKRCVNPAHLRASTIAAVSQAAAAKGAFSGVARAAKIAAFRRAESAKLDIDKAREIRLSSESGPVLAARFGVNKSVINSIKRGTSWKDYSNPYLALGAR